MTVSEISRGCGLADDVDMASGIGFWSDFEEANKIRCAGLPVDHAADSSVFDLDFDFRLTNCISFAFEGLSSPRNSRFCLGFWNPVSLTVFVSCSCRTFLTIRNTSRHQ